MFGSIGWGFWLNLDFFPSGLHTRTTVARNLSVSQLAFLFFLLPVRIFCAPSTSRVAAITPVASYSRDAYTHRRLHGPVSRPIIGQRPSLPQRSYIVAAFGLI